MDPDGRPGWLPSLGFAFLSFNCGMAIYRSIHDPYSVAFVVAAYLALILLFRIILLIDRHPPDPQQDRKLKFAVWGLLTQLIFQLCFKVAVDMPLWAMCLVWFMGIFATGAVFFAFFLASQEEP